MRYRSHKRMSLPGVKGIDEDLVFGCKERGGCQIILET